MGKNLETPYSMQYNKELMAIFDSGRKYIYAWTGKIKNGNLWRFLVHDVVNWFRFVKFMLPWRGVCVEESKPCGAFQLLWGEGKQIEWCLLPPLLWPGSISCKPVQPYFSLLSPLSDGLCKHECQNHWHWYCSSHINFYTTSWEAMVTVLSGHFIPGLWTLIVQKKMAQRQPVMYLGRRVLVRRPCSHPTTSVQCGNYCNPTTCTSMTNPTS